MTPGNDHLHIYSLCHFPGTLFGIKAQYLKHEMCLFFPLFSGVLRSLDTIIVQQTRNEANE